MYCIVEGKQARNFLWSLMASVTWSVVALLVIAGGIDLAVGCNVTYGLSPSCPGKSCLDIYHKNPDSHGVSQQYVVKNDGHLRFVYCDMKHECGGEKGWMRIAHITNGDNCPSGWRKITSPTKACRAPTDNAGCYSAHFTTYNIPYSRVCGMVVGIQKGTTDGFASLHYSSRSINGPYVDGVSITYGTPRKHIWTYGIGNSDKRKPKQPVNCPCSQYSGRLPPSFVHENYYCESGTVDRTLHRIYYTADPVWDGKGCSSENSCCSEPNLPWFYRQIPLTADNDIEARICRDEAFSNEGVLVQELQLYIQ